MKAVQIVLGVLALVAAPVSAWAGTNEFATALIGWLGATVALALASPIPAAWKLVVRMVKPVLDKFRPAGTPENPDL